jgi:AcrR family transcriptional regulator
VTQVAKQPRSRRGRPAKPPLSRQWIIDVTIDIMGREGLGKATMRRVAQELDTGPASLYVYVRNTAELHAAVIDRLLADVTVATGGHWQDRLARLITDYRDVLSQNPGLARSALVIRLCGPNFLVVFDRIMALLAEGGVEPAQTGLWADMLLLTTTASVAEHAMPEDGDIDAGTTTTAKQSAIVDAVRSADAADTPMLAQHADALLGGTTDQRWNWYLRTQIATIVAASQAQSSQEIH